MLEDLRTLYTLPWPRRALVYLASVAALALCMTAIRFEPGEDTASAPLWLGVAIGTLALVARAMAAPVPMPLPKPSRPLAPKPAAPARPPSTPIPALPLQTAPAAARTHRLVRPEIALGLPAKDSR